jgi:hypothetical protein
MTRAEYDAAIAEILGIHAMPWRLAAITAVTDAYAATQTRAELDKTRAKAQWQQVRDTITDPQSPGHGNVRIQETKP